MNSQRLDAPGAAGQALEQALARAGTESWMRRLWAKDASLWTGGDEAKRLSWLDAARGRCAGTAELDAFAEAVRTSDDRQIVLLGMGGSSLGPEVLAEMIGPAEGHPPLLVLDSTDPDQIARMEAVIDPARTLFIVSSKSGTTLEAEVLSQRLQSRVEAALGAGRAGAKFVAITDPGSPLEVRAKALGWAKVFRGEPGIGGRFSVLSHFGLAPAAAIGCDPGGLLTQARRMADACGADVPVADNPALRLGLLLGAAAQSGRDKVTIIADAWTGPLGAWLEQLLAESTGKLGRGLIPVTDEPAGAPGAYGADRLFVFLEASGPQSPGRARLADKLIAAGHPVARIEVAEGTALAQEFVRWEIATAVAGAVLRINPFDQPDVEASKVRAREIVAALRGGDAFSGVPSNDDWEAEVAPFLAAIGPGGYVGLLAWLDRNDANNRRLRMIRACIRDRHRLATSVGFGPRYLHSTGQAFKGGPKGGAFIVITATPAADLPTGDPGLSFGQLERAQALGDAAVLVERGRKVLHIDLGRDIAGGLERFHSAVEGSNA